jgi:hypothetical protein
VYVTLHVPDDKLQENELKVPPTFPSLQVIAPVGTFWEFMGSVIVAVTVTCPPEEMADADDIIETDTAP